MLLSKLDKQFPVEQFEATVSQSTVPSPPLKVMKLHLCQNSGLHEDEDLKQQTTGSQFRGCLSARLAARHDSAGLQVAALALCSPRGGGVRD